jgi:hypothetical protein
MPSPHLVLDEQFLFCKRYLHDLVLAHYVGFPINISCDSDVLKEVSAVQNQLGSGLVRKQGIQSILEEALHHEGPRM